MSGTILRNGCHELESWKIYLDRVFVGVVDRRLNQTSLDLPAAGKGRELAILVENTGRINYNIVLRNESKGILNSIQLAGKRLTGWSIFSLSMDHPETLHFRRSMCAGPCFFRTSLAAPSAPKDTFLDTTPIQKGFAWANGVSLGRAWSAGPQASLLIPGKLAEARAEFTRDT